MKIRKRQMRAVLDALWRASIESGVDGDQAQDQASEDKALLGVYMRQVDIEKTKVRELQGDIEQLQNQLKQREIELTGKTATLQKLNGQQDLFVRVARAIDQLQDYAFQPKGSRNNYDLWTQVLPSPIRDELAQIRKALRW
jgi:hypothetical protein